MSFVQVTGGKGGVGKTTLTANLGVELAQRGLRTLLVDLDFGLANLNVLFGLNAKRTLEDYFRGECRLADCIHRTVGGLHLVPGGSGVAGLSRDDTERDARLAADLDELARDYDLVLGDSAAGIGPEVLEFGRRADLVLVVTTPEPAALTDAYGLVKALDAETRGGAREVPTPELFLNLVQGSDQADRLAARLRRVCERFLARSPRLAGWLPRSNGVLSSSLTQRPFIGSARRDDRLEARCIARLARRLTGRLAPLGAAPGL